MLFQTIVLLNVSFAVETIQLKSAKWFPVFSHSNMFYSRQKKFNGCTLNYLLLSLSCLKITG